MLSAEDAAAILDEVAENFPPEHTAIATANGSATGVCIILARLLPDSSGVIPTAVIASVADWTTIKKLTSAQYSARSSRLVRAVQRATKIAEIYVMDAPALPPRTAQVQ